jgi:hypothetical protein
MPKKGQPQNEIDGVTKVFMNLYGLSYSLVFMDTLMWWVLQRDDFRSYYSITMHGVLIGLIYLPFVYEWIQMAPGAGWTPVVFALGYFAFNLAYVKVNGVAVYPKLDFKDWWSYFWCFIGVCLTWVGFFLGEWFSKIQRRYWLPKWGARVDREPEDAEIETNLNLEGLNLQVNNDISQISRTQNTVPINYDEENIGLTTDKPTTN